MCRRIICCDRWTGSSILGHAPHLAPFYSATGRPSVDPELMIRMLIVGYAFGIRSERRLCEEVHLNLAYRWFCRLDLTDPVPDHSTFSKNRHGRFRDSNLFRHLFEEVSRAASPRAWWEARPSGRCLAHQGRCQPLHQGRGAEWSPPRRPRARPRSTSTRSTTQPSARPRRCSRRRSRPPIPPHGFTGANGDRPFFAYSTNYLVDLENAIIVDVEATAPIRQAEVGAVRDMLMRTRDRSTCTRTLLAADTAYGAADMLGWLVEDQGIEPHIPVFDKSERKDGAYSATDFAYDHEADEYRCPGGKALKPYWRNISRADRSSARTASRSTSPGNRIALPAR
jgi:hypothetical protein